MFDTSWMPWAIGAAIIISFIYRKVWPFIRKMIRPFLGIRLNSKSAVSGERYKKLSIGSLYARQQGGYLNSLSLDIKDKLPTILGEWWGISSSRSAKETLDYLCQKGFDYYFPFVYKAFLLEDETEQDQIFQQNMTTQEDYDKATSQLNNLKETYKELMECGVISTKEDLARCGVLGWAGGRLNFLARACYDARYISEAEAWQYIDKAYELVYPKFTSWHDMAMSYVIGRAIWGGTSAYNSGMKSIADELLSNSKSPWVQIKW